MTRVRIVTKADWVPEGQMLLVDAESILAAPVDVWKRGEIETEPQKIIICHSDADGLRIRLTIEDHPELGMELIA